MFWEQKLGRTFSFRLGNQGPQSVFNFFRFKDARTSFTSSPSRSTRRFPVRPSCLAGLPVEPVKDPEFYVVWTLNDMNVDSAANGLDWGTFRLSA